MADIDLERIRGEWLRVCGSCDAGLAMQCTCGNGDPRRVIELLADEVERLRGFESAVLHVLALAPDEYRQCIVAARCAGPGADADYWRWSGQAQSIRQITEKLAGVAGLPAPDWEQIKQGVPADGVHRGGAS